MHSCEIYSNSIWIYIPLTNKNAESQIRKMKPEKNKSPNKSIRSSPVKIKLKPKRSIRKAQKRKKSDVTDGEWEEFDDSPNFQSMIQKKVDKAVENILENVNASLDKKLSEMINDYETKIEVKINKIVSEQIKQIKIKCEKSASDLATQTLVINSVKSLAGQNKSEIAKQNTKLTKLSTAIENSKKDMFSQNKHIQDIEANLNKQSEQESILDTKTRDIEKSLNFHAAEVDDLKKEIGGLKQQMAQHSASNSNTTQAQPTALTEALLQKIHHVHDTNLQQQAYSRRHNVLVDGVREHPHEDCVSIMADICSKVLGLHDFHRHIDKAHRYGPKRQTHPRPIIVRFVYHHDADFILSRSDCAKRAGLRFTPNYPKEIQRENALLYKVHRAAQQEGQETRLNANALHYKGKAYTVHNVHKSGLKTERVAERRDDRTIRFFGRFSKFSNFHPVTLQYQGFLFKSAEQLYHFKRAQMTNNESLAIAIALSLDPLDSKRLAKDIEPEKDRDLRIMREVIEMKFSKDTFKKELVNTKKAELIECNPHDRFWGSGYHLDEKTPTKSGANHLGNVIMEFRNKIVNQLK